MPTMDEMYEQVRAAGGLQILKPSGPRIGPRGGKHYVAPAGYAGIP
jgi:hypothetical protein